MRQRVRYIFNTVVNKKSHVNAVFAALADPTRRSILERLSGRRERRVTALARPFRMSLPAISRHVRVLEEARLVRRRRAGRVHLIRAHPAGLKDARLWIARYVEFWESRFEAMDKLLKTEARKEKMR